MNAITRTNIRLSIATIFLTAVLAVPASAQRQVSITGEIHGQETDRMQGGPPPPCPPAAICVEGSVLGQATHIGRFTLGYKVTVALPAGNSSGTATLTASNEDEISTTIVGQGIGVPNTATLNSVMEVHAITGGTGRFEGVTGYLIVYRLIDLATGVTSGSIIGSLTLPAR